MAEDYYKTLGIARDASQDEIQKAYRDLARKYHPDLNPEDKAAKENFQQVQMAFDVLNDANKRELYDRYGSSFEGMGGGPGGPRPTWRTTGEGGAEDVDLSQFFGERFGPGAPGGFADIFSQFRRAGRPGARDAGPRGGRDVLHELEIPFNTAIIGGEAQLTVQRASGKVDIIAVKIPAGIEDGKKIRLRGQGEPSPTGGPAGDILIGIRVAPHPCFHRRGSNLYVNVPLTLTEAALGAKIDIPTPKGTVALTVPPNSSGGSRLRIKGHGVSAKGGSAGDLIAEIQIVLPEQLDDESREAVKRLESQYRQNPRRNLRW